MNESENPLAFPLVEQWAGREEQFNAYGVSSGMTLRDYFAAKALTGALSMKYCSMSDAEGIARWSYKMADAMLEARSA
ncbi:MAG: hypothetical protein LBO00_01710 [Zoogloeaceae bacterium]|jgi:hypothetical protein|nr:hypothetical protein [Zoogloeaceae bacterium]